MKPGPVRTLLAAFLVLTLPVWYVPVFIWRLFVNLVQAFEDDILS